MAKYSVNDLPENIKLLFASARENKVSPPDFCRALAGLGVKGALAMFYVRDAFNLPLEKAKALVIETEHGSVESWAQDVGDAVDEL